VFWLVIVDKMIELRGTYLESRGIETGQWNSGSHS
jgi:hypothetical protein